jgi:von Willebrand factor type A domain-containing protein
MNAHDCGGSDRMRASKSVLGLVLGGLAVAAVAAPGAHAAAACTKVTNVEAIVDDSGSMDLTDPTRLRVQAMDLLINALDPGAQLGAVEFGSSLFGTDPAADVVFPVEPVGANAAAMKAALDAKIQGDAGSTDYNAAFATGRAADPAAQARIFLTDGGHNAGDYANGHLNPTPPQTPTYVIGFGSGLSQPEDQQRLQKIADDTGGKYFPLADNSALQAVMNEIETTLTCQSPPKTFKDNLAQGKTKVHNVRLTKKAKSAQIALSWPNALDAFKITGVRIVRGGKVVARAAKVRKLKVKVHKGSTFAVVKVTHLVKGKLRFAVKATKIGSGAPKVTLTTQVSQTRRH